MVVRALLYVGLAYGLVWVLLWRINRKREDRHLQGWSPLLALVFVGEALLLLRRLETSEVGREIERALRGLRSLLEEGGAVLAPTAEATHLLFGWIAVALFLLAKLFLMGVHRLLQRLARRSQAKAAVERGDAQEPPTPSLAYEREVPSPHDVLVGSAGRVVLASRWE
ncbi:MAG: hypothetical protein AAFU38_03875, partial [Bacteroidota bacterium]